MLEEHSSLTEIQTFNEPVFPCRGNSSVGGQRKDCAWNMSVLSAQHELLKLNPNNRVFISPSRLDIDQPHPSSIPLISA